MTRTRLALDAEGERFARERLAARVERFRSERDRARERPSDPGRRELTRQLEELGERTRALPGIGEITEEEIAAEIEAYRRGH